MSNSFNISVKPEISALEAKVDIIDTEVGLTKTDTAAILIDSNEVQGKLPTDYIMGSSDVDNHDGQIEQIMATSFAIEDKTINLPADPASNTEVNANETKIDANKSVVDAIKAKTDILPQKFRGSWKINVEVSASAVYVDVINFTGSGKLAYLSMYCVNSADTVQVLITLDGVAFTAITHTGDTVSQALVPRLEYVSGEIPIIKLPAPQITPQLFDIEFNTSCLVQVQRSAGTTDNVNCTAAWFED